jgi:hypothetical protein
LTSLKSAKAQHNESWKSYLQYAGRSSQGIVTEAFVVPREAEIGEPVLFVVSTRNLRQCTFHYLGCDAAWPSEVLIRDASGKPILPNKKGRQAWSPVQSSESFSNGIPEDVSLRPGFAVSEKVPLDEYFDLSRPGTYTVLGRGANAVSFQLRKPGAKSPGTSTRLSVYRPAESFEEKWKRAILASGQPHDDLLLEATLSPVDPRAVNLVVSLRNICTSGKIAPGWAYSYSRYDYMRDRSMPIDAAQGTSASRYRILVRDNAGRAVPLTEGGKTWLASHELKAVQPLRPGEAIGFVFPLHEMFSIKAGQNYSVLVILPGKAADDPAWIASRVEITAPENAGSAKQRKG